MTLPLVSIIIPAYNHETYITECITSALAQTYKPIEIIVVDDGSTDKTADIAEDILASYPSSKFVRRKNSGAANAINFGISIAAGSYINILNSDDFFALDRIATCIDTVLRNNSELIFTGVNFVDEASNPAPVDAYMYSIADADRRSYSYPTVGFALLKNQLAISTGNFFFSRNLYDKVGPFASYKYVHDWDFILRSLFFTEPLRIPEHLYNYRFHGQNSFKSLEDVAGYETKEVMRNLLWLMTSRRPVNGLAPSPYNWHDVFFDFIRANDYEVYMPPRFRDMGL